ncbi:MAG: PAS domain S-box protein [Gracilimonas sp.]|nr:histidine kinase dimerization/phosphoacceptor domain -containing protein [Gracilimonas sp.]MBO6584773.1 PAS domain S-box protein [Gracilimonas sp.]MBO6615956.1 PAS domain S-box protein [Gracilimonas sp.]
MKLIHEITQLNDYELSVSDLIRNASHLISKFWPEQAGVLVSVSFDDISHHSGHESSNTEFYKTGYEAGGLPVVVSVSAESDHHFNEDDTYFIETACMLVASKIDRILSKQRIQEEQELIDKAYQLAHIGTWEYDMINHELHWSDITKQVHGFEADYHPDVESTIQLFKEGYHRETFAKAAYDAIEHEIPFDVELKIISGKGDERWIRATGEPEYADGQCIRFYGISQNVTGRRKAEEDLELNERRFKALVQNGMDMIAILDEEGNYTYASPASKNVLNLPPEYFMDKNAFDLIHQDDKDRLYTLFTSLSNNETVQINPFRFLNNEKQWRWLEGTITNLSNDPAVKGYVVNTRDITERQIKHEQILDSLREKETLLSEIHHRIKNNLSVLVTMLHLQASDEQNEAVLDRLLDSIARIHTMASIHEQLYQTKNYAALDFSERLKLLAQTIKKTLQTDVEVELVFNCQPLSIPVEYALTCSLVVNEVLTNVFKHAFSGMEKGRVNLDLNPEAAEDKPHLKISDNGVGLPSNFNPTESDSLGLSLIDMLSEQIAEDYSFSSSDKGTVFTLTFSKEVLESD